MTTSSTPSPSDQSDLCKDCNAPLVDKHIFGLLTTKNSTPCTKCETKLCHKCADTHTLIPFDGKEDLSSVSKSFLKSFCKDCFREVSILDYSKTYDVIDPSTESNNITLFWVHGGGSSRAMFRHHARELSSKGYRSILIDLPGHGSLVDTPLTLDSCVETTQNILDREGCAADRTIYIGGSLGAYIGFHILSHQKTKFASAIFLDCGQNVGPDCSLKARLGLWLLRTISKRMSNKSITETMMKTAKKSKADYHLLECCYGSGMFFQQGVAQCECLHTVKPADIIPMLDFPMLFFNGSEDYRDSEEKWLDLCKDKERSDLKVYEGGDHFFCHDSRFVGNMLERMDEFIKVVVK